MSHTKVSGHNFHIEAVTAAFQAGLEDSLIQALGHWNLPT